MSLPTPVTHSLSACLSSDDEPDTNADFKFIYGAPGTGKSSFAAGFPNALFVRIDPKGTQSLPRSIAKTRVPLTWDEQDRQPFDPMHPSVMGLLRTILDSEEVPGTLVLDTVSQAETLLFEYLCKKGGVDSIELYDGGYGHGWTKSTELMHKMIQLLNQINGRGVEIIAISHAGVVKMPNAGGVEYNQWGPNIVKKTADLWMAVASTVIFAQADGDITTKDLGKKTEKSKIKFSGRTLAHVVPGQGWFAKNRDCLPSPMVLDADVFREEARAGQALKEQYYTLREGLTAAQRADMGERMAIAGWSRDSLVQTINELTTTTTKDQE